MGAHACSENLSWTFEKCSFFPPKTPGHANFPPLANHPCHTMMAVPRTALVLGGLAKTGADCTQRAVSPPGRTAACACDCIGLGLFSFSCNGPTVAAWTGLPGCAGYTALAPTPTPNGGVPAPSDCGLANWRRLHTACSEPARANCSMCHPVLGAFSKKGWSALLLAPTQVTAPEAGDSHTGADCTHVVESWNRAHSDTMQ